MKVLYNETTKLPVKMWLETVEDGAMEQIMHLANFHFAFHHIAIMPDCHQGYGMPIGGVMATKNVIIPNAVGVDIGCGMCAVKTPWTIGTDISLETIKRIMGKIREQIPVGFKHQSTKQSEELMPSLLSLESAFKNNYENSICKQEYSNAREQLGTLGGGNHFIEIQKDTQADVWIMIHSGSRNLGKKVADYYGDLAIKLNKKWGSGTPVSWELAYLPFGEEVTNNYIGEMNYCVEFALANRKLMLENIANIFDKEISWRKIDLTKMINIAHNYARMEHHFDQDVMVHRKGATSARDGEIGIIPGSQGTKSYIVRGKGNKDSFESCSHGAGRKMGRKEAERTLNLEAEIKILDDQGIIHGIETKEDLDEASGAYKDINQVMTNQADLVEIVTELSPIAVIKG